MAEESMTFEEALGQANKPAADEAAPAPSAAPKADEGESMSFEDAQSATLPKTIVEKLAGAPHRVLMAIGNFVDQAINPRNWTRAATETAGVVGDIPAALTPDANNPLALAPLGSIPKEMRQGMVKEAVHLPSQLLADLPRAGGDALADLLLGPGESAKAHEASTRAAENLGLPQIPSPLDLLSSQSLDRALDVMGLSPWVNGAAEEALSGPEKLQRRVGEFAAAAPVAGAKAIVPSAVAAVPARIAEETAPNDPIWQILSAGAGAFLPEMAVRGVASTLPKGIKKLPATTPEGRQAATGADLAKTVEGRSPIVAPTPVPGLRPTLAQATDDTALLNRESAAAAEDPKLKIALEDRAKENATVLEGAEASAQSAAKTGLEDLRGTGVADDAKKFAEDTLKTERQAHEAELLKVRGVTRPTDVNDTAAARIEARLKETTDAERALWEKLKALGDRAAVRVEPLKAQVREWLGSLTGVRREHLPAELNGYLKTLDNLGKAPKEPGAVEGVEVIRPGEAPKPTPDGTVNLFELQDLRSMLRQARQDAASGATPNRTLAHYYGELETRVSKYLDSFKFDDAAVQQAYQDARGFTKQRAGIFNVPREMRKVLGQDAAGADLVSSGVTLDTFIKPGPAGRDSIRQLIAADASPEMRELVVQRLAHDVPDNPKAIKKWLDDHEPLISELDGASGPVGASPTYNRFRAVYDRAKAVEKLGKSPLGMLLDSDPEKVVARIVSQRDPAAAAQQLRSQFGGDIDAWRGMQRTYADRVIKAVSSPDGTISPDKLAKFIQNNAKLNAVFLDSAGARALTDIEAALKKSLADVEKGKAMVARKGTRVPTTTDKRILDLVIDAIGGVGGLALGGVEGGIVGTAAGIGITRLRDILRTNAQETLREALLDPKMGADLMRKATRASLTAMAKPQRSWLGEIVKGVPGAAVEGAKAAEEGPTRRVPAAAAPVDPTKPPDKVGQNTTPATNRRVAERGGRRYAVTPLMGGKKFIVQLLEDRAKEIAQS